MKFTRNVACDNEFADVPVTMVVFITPELAKRIVELSEEVKRLGVDSVRLWNAEPSWYRRAEDDDTGIPVLGAEWNAPTAYLHINKKSFWWSSYFGDWGVRSDYITIDDIIIVARRQNENPNPAYA